MFSLMGENLKFPKILNLEIQILNLQYMPIKFLKSQNPCLVLVQQRKIHPDMTEKLLTGT